MDILITREIIENVPILIVDVEQKYLEDEDVYGLISQEYHQEVKQELQDRMDTIYEHLKLLNNPLFVTHETKLYSKLETLPIKHLQYWLTFKHKYNQTIINHIEYLNLLNSNSVESFLFEIYIHNDIYESLKHFEQILVCGLWKDRCVFTVTQLLRDKGVNAILIDNDNYTIGSEVIGDGYPLEDVARHIQREIKYIN